jgi:hypothetical protein
MATLVSRFAARSRREQVLLSASALLLLSCRGLLAVVGLDRARWVSRRLARIVPPRSVEQPDHITWAVTCAAAFLPGSGTCLAQAVVGEALLAAHGYSSTVRLGVKKSSAEFAAHAWVEREDTVVIGELSDLDQYQPLSEWSGR